MKDRKWIVLRYVEGRWDWWNTETASTAADAIQKSEKDLAKFGRPHLADGQEFLVLKVGGSVPVHYRWVAPEAGRMEEVK